MWVRNILLILPLIVTYAHAQVSQFPYVQNFDTTSVDSLPPGWSSTQNRSPGTNDFTTASGSARSIPNAVLSTNPRISQTLFSPLLNFTSHVVDSIIFYERRSATDTTGILVEASIDSGISYPLAISDTLQLLNPATYVRRAFPLPQTLSGEGNVQIRWRVLGDLRGGATATLRFDDMSITVKTQFDAGVTSIRFLPQFPVVGDSVDIATVVRNYGIQSIQNFLVELYDDVNRDSLPQTSELFDTVRVLSQILPGDSATVSSLMRNLLFGDKQIIVQTALPNDENPLNDRRITSLSVGVAPFSIAINEIMYGPTSPEPEWVELTNITTDSINLRQWKISDRNTTVQATITTADFYLLPNQFVLVAKDSAALMAAHPGIPVRVFHVSSLATLNNDSDAVVVFDHRGVIVDSVNYMSSWGGTSGRSLERIDARGPSNLQSNWGSSTNPARSTPGRKNSLTPKDIDIAVARIAFSPATPVVGDSVFVQPTIKNLGLLAVQNVLVQFFKDANGDSLPQPQELFDMLTISQLGVGDSITASTLWQSLEVGDHLFIVNATLTGDEDTTNNLQHVTVAAGYSPGTLVVNEVMYAPVGAEPEWLEVYNVAADSINLKNWKVSNRNSSTRYTITATDIFILRDQYAVITKDTALFFAVHPNVTSTVIQAPSMSTFLFNNNGDAVVLFDSRGAVMDSLPYLPTWGGTNGKSLERIDALLLSNDSTNWGSSLDSVGSTPGKQNSLSPVDYDLRATRLSTQVDFPSLNVSVVVTNVGREVASGYSVALFYDANGDSLPQTGELLERRMMTNVLQPRDSLAVDFTWSDPGYGQKGLMALVEYSQDLRPANNLVYGIAKIYYPAQSLVINEIMYAPLSGQAEYVDLYNRGGLTVDLRDWKISDMRDATGVANEFIITGGGYMVQPGSYVVVSSDSSILQRYSLVPDSANGVHIFILNRSNLSLNNDGDDVVLSDLTGAIVDSVRYTPGWHNAQIADASGRSLERINPELPSNDRRNWSTSAHFLGGTPGRQNSIFTTAVPSSASLSFSPNPFSPDGDGFEDFTLISYEVPSSAALLRVRIYDARGRLIRTLVHGEPTGMQGSVVWDGMNDSRDKVRMGIYVVLLEALDAFGTTIHSTKAAVVVAVKL